MRLRPTVFLTILAMGFALRSAAQPPEATGGQSQSTPAEARAPAAGGNPKLKGYAPEGGVGRKLHVVPIDGTIDLGLAHFVERVVANAAKDDIILLNVQTFGGRVDAAVRIRDALLATDTLTVAYVRRAISAGALISLACDTLVMNPGATIGAATPVQQGQGGEMQPTSEKVVSYMRTEMAATATATGRPAEVAAAMVDADIEIKGVVDKGKVLTLATDKAIELGVADAAANSVENTLALLNLSEAQQVVQKTDWGESVARFLTDPVVSSLLMTVGFLALMSELLSPGFGLGGLVGIVCIGLFFLGQYAAKLAGAEEVVVFIVGVGLLALEVLVIPGFGLAGILGIGCIAVALGMALVELDLPLDVSFELGYLQDALSVAVVRLAVVMVLVGVVGALLFRLIPRSRTASWLVFRPETPTGGTQGLGAEAPGSSLGRSYVHLTDKEGLALTVLRPSGLALIEGERYDVLTDGQFVEANTPVKVVKVEGTKIVVRALDARASHEDA